jgi:hypothetical protein
MIQRITPIRADRFAVTKPGVEHQSGGRCRVCGKYGKHRCLIFVPEMKEAIPSQYAVKSATKGQGPHIADDPLLIGHPRSA